MYIDNVGYVDCRLELQTLLAALQSTNTRGEGTAGGGIYLGQWRF